MKIITSESVFKGHPDKVCDQISDAILDACLIQDRNSRVAVECLFKDDIIVIAGEITTNAKISISGVALSVLNDIGIIGDYRIIEKISTQSQDISIGVDKEGAGDQGIMYGYATDETEEYMPLSLVLARNISMRMDSLTKNIRNIFGADGKCQVSVEYDNDTPVRVATIVISQQTAKDLNKDFYVNFINNECINKVIPAKLLKNTEILINPTGEFSVGGSFADCGLTGRKIIVDTYGGVAKHGGGAFSGKDTTKVDRIGAYYCRYVAKHIVASGLAKKCEVGVSFAIGTIKPISLNVYTYRTGLFNDKKIMQIVNSVFDFSTSNIKKTFSSDLIRYQDLASYGHFGRTDLKVPWENLDKLKELKEYVKQGQTNK